MRLNRILWLVLPFIVIDAYGQNSKAVPVAARNRIVTQEIDGPVDHNHCTTRQFQHMSFQYQGVWFVFYSDGKDFRYQTSDNGITWNSHHPAVTPAPNGSTGFDVLQVGDKVYLCHVHYPLGRYDPMAPYAKDPARRGEYASEGRIKVGQIEGSNIRWLVTVDPGFSPDYSNLLRDSDGFLWVFSREGGQGVAYRSRYPNDIQDWLPPSVCMPVNGRHAMDAASLDDGKLFVVSMLTTGGKLYGNFYNGDRWDEEPILISGKVTQAAGDDRRLAIEFDPTSHRLHLIYVDADNVLRYRQLDSPYHFEDFRPPLSEPGLALESNIFTAALSVDSSFSPYQLMITYGLQQYLGSDNRHRTGEIWARPYDGQDWNGQAMLISQPGTIYNWYPNVNQDVRQGLCVLYSRSINPEAVSVPLAVMVSLSGQDLIE